MRLRLELALDVLGIVLFAAIGRRSHGESGVVAGVAVVAAPFLAGWLAGAALVRLDRRPSGVVRALRALVVALPLALVVRAATGRGVPPTFVVVAACFLGLVLVGRRALSTTVVARRARRPRY
jgi:hypothetical protein